MATDRARQTGSIDSEGVNPLSGREEADAPLRHEAVLARLQLCLGRDLEVAFRRLLEPDVDEILVRYVPGVIERRDAPHRGVALVASLVEAEMDQRSIRRIDAAQELRPAAD